MLSVRTKQLHFAAIFALPVIWIIWLSGGWTTGSRAVVLSLDVFVQSIIERPVLHDFKPKEMQEYCSRQTWQDDLVFECHGLIGGIGSIRQQIFTCIRWAMASGAGILMPRPHPRQQTNSSLGEEVNHKYQPNVELGYFFDTEAFKSTMHTLCPQMKLYDTLDGRKDIDDIGEFKPDIKLIGQGWTEDLYQNISQSFLSNHKSKKDGHIRFAHFNRHFKESRICSDGEGFANAMGHILQTRQDVMRLAALVLYQLSTRFNLHIDPKEVLAPGRFAGVHLRTSSDATAFGWMGFEDQVKLYQEYLGAQPVPVIYVASGNLTSIEMFGQRVAPTPVVNKFSLLSSEDAASLRSMTWDQQGQVDYLVLSRASLYLGMVDSLFSVGIASSRRAVSQSGTCGEVSTPRKDITFDDGVSVVVGKHRWFTQAPDYFWP